MLAAALTLGAPQPAMLAARAADADAGESAVDKRRLAVERRKEMLAKACVLSARHDCLAIICRSLGRPLGRFCIATHASHGLMLFL